VFTWPAVMEIRAASLTRWSNVTFALALLAIAGWSEAVVIAFLVDVARGTVSSADPHGTGTLWAAMTLVALLGVLALAAGWRRRNRRSRLRSKLIVLAPVAALLGLSIAGPAPWGLAWGSVVVLLLLASVAVEPKLPRYVKAAKPSSAGVCGVCGRLLGSTNDQKWQTQRDDHGTTPTLCRDCAERTSLVGRSSR
jgi:hypothetical protein